MAEFRFDRKALKILKLNPRILIELSAYDRAVAVVEAYKEAKDKRAARHAIEIVYGSETTKGLLQIIKQ